MNLQTLLPMINLGKEKIEENTVSGFINLWNELQHAQDVLKLNAISLIKGAFIASYKDEAGEKNTGIVESRKFIESLLGFNLTAVLSMFDPTVTEKDEELLIKDVILHISQGLKEGEIMMFVYENTPEQKDFFYIMDEKEGIKSILFSDFVKIEELIAKIAG